MTTLDRRLSSAEAADATDTTDTASLAGRRRDEGDDRADSEPPALLDRCGRSTIQDIALIFHALECAGITLIVQLCTLQICIGDSGYQEENSQSCAKAYRIRRISIA